MLLVSLMMIAWASWPPLAAGSRQRRIAIATNAPCGAPTWPRQRPRRPSSAALDHRGVDRGKLQPRTAARARAALWPTCLLGVLPGRAIGRGTSRGRVAPPVCEEARSQLPALRRLSGHRSDRASGAGPGSDRVACLRYPEDTGTRLRVARRGFGAPHVGSSVLSGGIWTSVTTTSGCGTQPCEQVPQRRWPHRRPRIWLPRARVPCRVSG